MDLDGLLDQHATLTGQLVDAISDLGETRAALERARRDLWDSTAHLGITERREQIKASCAPLEADAATQYADCEMIRAQIAHIEWRLRVACRIEG